MINLRSRFSNAWAARVSSDEREASPARIRRLTLILKGYIAFLDPPKDSAAKAIKAL